MADREGCAERGADDCAYREGAEENFGADDRGEYDLLMLDGALVRGALMRGALAREELILGEYDLDMLGLE